MLPDDPNYISSTEYTKITIYEYLNYSMIDSITIPQLTGSTSHRIFNMQKLPGMDALIAVGLYIETLVEYTPKKLTVKFSIVHTYIFLFSNF